MINENFLEYEDLLPSGHHIIPQSRNGDKNNGNLIKIPEFWHACWHHAFANLTPREVLKVVHKIEVDNTGEMIFFPKEYSVWRAPKKFKTYWVTLFEDLSRQEVVILIKHLFLQKNKAAMKKFWKMSDIERLKFRIKNFKIVQVSLEESNKL